MALEDFTSDNEKDNNSGQEVSDKKQGGAVLEVSDSFAHTPCDCDISTIDVCPTYDLSGNKTTKRSMNELDIVGHLREKHGWSFRKAVKRVTILQAIKD